MDIVRNFFLKSAYGLIGAAGAALLFTAQNFKPEGDMITGYIWNSILVGLLTGAAATIKRWLSTRKPV